MSSSESDFEIDEVNNLVYIMTLNKAYFYHIITSVVRKWKHCFVMVSKVFNNINFDLLSLAKSIYNLLMN